MTALRPFHSADVSDPAAFKRLVKSTPFEEVLLRLRATNPMLRALVDELGSTPTPERLISVFTALSQGAPQPHSIGCEVEGAGRRARRRGDRPGSSGGH